MSGMRAAGLDIGSRTVGFVVLDDATRPVVSDCFDTTPDVEQDFRRLLRSHTYDALVVTGYGRAMAELELEAQSVTEISAHARGARAVFPDCRTILDVGGQDTKAIALDDAGRVTRFEMNDRCAAGAGKFLEMTARALGYDIADFGPAALGGRNSVRLSSMCAVFAESEVVGLVTKGRAREDIALAIHTSIHRRNVAMLRRVGFQAPLCFSGGAARNRCLTRLLTREFGGAIRVAEQPELIGALGAALIAAGRCTW